MIGANKITTPVRRCPTLSLWSNFSVPSQITLKNHWQRFHGMYPPTTPTGVLTVVANSATTVIHPRPSRGILLPTTAIGVLTVAANSERVNIAKAAANSQTFAQHLLSNCLIRRNVNAADEFLICVSFHEIVGDWPSEL
jgi:hypothetical protein